jgi:hypothetical protein
VQAQDFHSRAMSEFVLHPRKIPQATTGIFHEIAALYIARNPAHRKRVFGLRSEFYSERQKGRLSEGPDRAYFYRRQQGHQCLYESRQAGYRRKCV